MASCGPGFIDAPAKASIKDRYFSFLLKLGWHFLWDYQDWGLGVEVRAEEIRRWIRAIAYLKAKP